MKTFAKKNFKILLSLVCVFIFIAFIYYCLNQKDLINALSSIIAIPSLMLSVLVLKVIDIRPENLDAYHRLRVMQENEKKYNKKKAIEAFDEKLKEVERLNRGFQKLYRNKINKDEINNALITQCKKGVEDLKDFFSETNVYIFKDFLPMTKNLGEIQQIVSISISLIDLDNESKLREGLDKLQSNIFEQGLSDENKQLSDENKQLLELLFDKNSLVESYLSTCNRAYELMRKGGEDDEI